MKAKWPQSAARLALSRQLWPDPFLAPDVPPREQIGYFLANPGAINEDFAAQLDTSIEARRALEILRRESDACFSLPPRAPENNAAASLANDCVPGEVWLGKCTVEYWSGSTRLKRRISALPEFLILTEPIHSKNDQYVQAVPLTDAAIWPEQWQGDYDQIVEIEGIGEFIAHLDMPVRISLHQFYARVGVLQRGDMRKLGEVATAAPSLAPRQEPQGAPRTEIEWDRERLRIRASWLGATSHALDMEGREPVTDWLRAAWERTLKQMDATGKIVAGSCGEWVERIIGAVQLPVAAGLRAHELDHGREQVLCGFCVVGTRASVIVTECVSPARTFALGVVTDPDGVLENAEVLDAEGRLLTKISQGVAAGTFNIADGRFLVRMTDGTIAFLAFQGSEEPRWLRTLIRVARHRGSMRLLGDDALAELSERHPDPSLRVELLAEMLQRAWLFGGSTESLSALPLFREVFARAGVPYPGSWIASQRTMRSFTLPQEWAASEAVRASFDALLVQWRKADGLIAFIRYDHDLTVRESVALPFTVKIRHAATEPLVTAANRDTDGLEELADGVRAANLAAHAAHWLPPGLPPGICLNTLPGGCMPPLGGSSAGFAVLLAHRLRHECLHLQPLEVAASGAITDDGRLMRATDIGGYNRKRDLLEALGVRTSLLPEPIVDGWPCGVSLDEKFAAVVDVHRDHAELFGPLALQKRVDELAAGMRREGLDSQSARDELVQLIQRHLPQGDEHLEDLRTEALLALAAAECHLGNPRVSEAILQPLLVPDAPLFPHLQALIRQAVNLTDFGDYSTAVRHCDAAIELAATPRLLSRALRGETEMLARGTKGQALMFHGMWESALVEPALVELRRAAALAAARDRSGLPAELSRNLAYVVLWHALHRPSEMDIPYQAAWNEAVSRESMQTETHLLRYRWLAGYRAALLGAPDCWPGEGAPLPDPAIEGWPYRTACKYRGAARAARGETVSALADFQVAAEMADWPVPILRFIGGTAALQAGESLLFVAPQEAREFLHRAEAVFRGLQSWYSGPIAGEHWLTRVVAIREGKTPASQPQLFFPY